VGDKLRVSVEGGVVKYYRNATVVYTSTVPPTYPLLVDTSLNTSGGQIADVVLSGELAETVRWTNQVSVTTSGLRLVRPSGSGWNAGAVSARGLGFGDGYAEYTVTTPNTDIVFGLSDDDTTQSEADVDFALFANSATGQLEVLEDGNVRGVFGPYALGDKLRVAVEGGELRYYRNSTLLFVGNYSPRYPLLVDTSLGSAGAVIEEAVLSGELVDMMSIDVLDTCPVPTSDVVWTTVVNAEPAGSTLTRSPGWGWNAGAVSMQAVSSGTACAEYTVTSPAGYVMFGLSVGDTDQDFADIDFAIYAYGATQQLWVYEGGIPRGTVGTFQAGDRLRVSVENNAVTYRKNGVLLYTSTLAPGYPLLIDTSLLTGGSAIGNAQIGGAQ
jgi:hypothetical protein